MRQSPMTMRIILTIFILWHAFAIGIYAMPREATDTFSQDVRSVLLPLVDPYVRTTMQWQQWNLFAPNPSRTYNTYTLRKKADNRWVVIEDLTDVSRTDARYHKFLLHLFDGYTQEPEEEAKKLVHNYCSKNDMHEGESIRLYARTYAVNNQTEPLRTAFIPLLCP